jgi:transcriptional regulator with XRE-family HTH domain
MSAKVQHNELGKKIKGLRDSLGASTQEAFAAQLGVKRSQVSAWEHGKEEPSKEKLIALGNLSEYPLQLWFWERAGVATQKLQDHVRRQMIQKRNDPALANVTSIRRMDVVALLRSAAGEDEESETGSPDLVPFPSLFISKPASTICIQAPDRPAGTPDLAGNLVLVELARKGRDERAREGAPFAAYGLPLDRLAAVLFEKVPDHPELSPEASRRLPPARLFTARDRKENELNRSRDPLRRAETDRQNEELWQRVHAEATMPGVLFGTPKIQSVESWDGDFNHFKKGGLPWRLVLHCGALYYGLTDWSTDEFPWNGTLIERIKSEIHVLGVVIGWLRAPGRQSDQ